jgi:hypothetical protein
MYKTGTYACCIWTSGTQPRHTAQTLTLCVQPASLTHKGVVLCCVKTCPYIFLALDYNK